METVMERDDLRSVEVCERIGMTYRRLDHLVREGVIEPKHSACGPGSTRTWAPEQSRVLRAILVLRDHGAGYDTLRAFVRSAEDLTEHAWETRVLVTIDGRITTLLGADANGWLVDLAHCRDDVAERDLVAA